MKRDVIITCANSRAGDFLVEHWLASLQANVVLDNIDVVVLDYGLSDLQRERLAAKSVLVETCESDGHPVNLRFRDAPRVLAEKGYRNALQCDGGDIIFQADISYLLQAPLSRMHALKEPRPVGKMGAFFGGGKNADSHLRKLQRRFLGEPMINVGVMLGPVQAYVEMWNVIGGLTDDWSKFGTDQLLISEYLLANGFEALDKRYNFLPWYFTQGLRVREGRIMDCDGVIPLVHNSGWVDANRQFDRFGFGPDRNRRRPILAAVARLGEWRA